MSDGFCPPHPSAILGFFMQIFSIIYTHNISNVETVRIDYLWFRSFLSEFFFHNFHTSMFFSQFFIFQIFLILCAKLNFPVFCFWRISLLSQYIPPIISKLWRVWGEKSSPTRVSLSCCFLWVSSVSNSILGRNSTLLIVVWHARRNTYCRCYYGGP